MITNRLLSRIGRGLIYLPKTLYINLKTLPLSGAFKFPYVVMGPCSLQGLNRETMVIDAPLKRGMIRIGAQKTAKRGIHVNKRTSLIVEKRGRIVFRGSASIGAGSSLCASGGIITLGDEFSCNVNCFLYSMSAITMGKDVLLGWNINIRDNDGHPIYREGVLCNPNKAITIGDKVWIASYVDILKGVDLASGTIVGTRSLVTKSVIGNNLLIAGTPAREIRDHVVWSHNDDLC